MNNAIDEFTLDELSSVVGGGIVDNVLAETEASTTAFLKQFAESSQRFTVFINSPGNQAPTPPQE